MWDIPWTEAWDDFFDHFEDTYYTDEFCTTCNSKTNRTYPPRGTRVGPTWDPDGPPNPMIPYGIHGGLVGYVTASRRLSRGVGAAPGEPRAEANYDFLISTPRETRVEREHGHIWTV